MKIKTTLKIAYEAAKDYPNLKGLKLLGTEELYNSIPSLKTAKITSKENSFLSIYDLANSFYYRIDILVGQDSIANEIGVGELTEHEGNIVLIRTQPLYVQPPGDERCVAYGCNSLDVSEYNNVMVTSYVPTNIIEALPDPHMVITSIGDHHPHPVKVEEDSILGRRDGDIESLKISEISAVAPTYKNMHDAPKIKGSIIYSEEWDCLKWYNGKEWRTL